MASYEIAELKREIAELEALYAQDAAVYDVYKPHAKQKLFHAAVERGRTVFAIAGIRSGKSIAGANELIDRALAEPIRAVFCAPTYADAREILDYTVLAYLPFGEIKDRSKVEHFIKLKNGSVLLWRSAEEPERLRALGDIDIFWLDEAEQMSPLVYTIAEGRVARRKGKILITTSPQRWFGSERSKRSSWIYDLLANEGIALGPGEAEYWNVAGDVAAINWSANDNPYFDRNELDRLRDRYGALWSAQELDGQYVDLYAGGIFKEEWFKIAPLPPDFDQVLISYDPAISEKSGADFSCAQVWGRVRDTAYLIAEFRGRINYIKQKELLRELVKKYAVHRLLIEDVAFQRSLIEDLAAEGLPVKAVRPDGDKVARAARLSGPLAAGKVLFGENILVKDGKRNTDFINEFASFPNTKHDDRVDAAGYAIYELLQGTGPVVYTPPISDPGYVTDYDAREFGGLSESAAEHVGRALRSLFK